MVQEPSQGISRRTLAKGMAWTVPAVAIASAVPMVAASVTCTGSLCLTGDFCKLPGNSTQGCDGNNCSKGYRANATIAADSRDRIVLVKQSTTAGNSTSELPRICGAGTTPSTCTCTVTVPSGYAKVFVAASTTATPLTIDVCGFGNSQNTTITLDYYIYVCASGGSACQLLEHASTSGGAHPC